MAHAWIKRDVDDDAVTQLTLGGGYSMRSGDSSMLLLHGYIGHSAYSNYDAMDTTSVSLGANYLFSFANGYHDTIYSLGLRVDHADYSGSADRSGEFVSFDVRADKRLMRGWIGGLTYQYLRRFGRDDVYRNTRHFIGFETEYEFLPQWSIVADWRYLKGDLVIQALGSPTAVPGAIEADKRVEDPAFSNCRIECESWSYRYEGDGELSSLGIVYQVNESISVDLTGEWYKWETDSGVFYDDWTATFGLVWTF